MKISRYGNVLNFDTLSRHIVGVTEHFVNNNTANRTATETVSFHDATPEWRTSIETRPDSTFDLAFMNDTTLSDFFKRPILVNTTTWTPAQLSPFYLAIQPWSLFFNNKRVANRISNYNLLKCNLHIKCMINGNGFYYGKLIANYVPLKNYDSVTVVNGLSPEVRIGASQRMHFYLDPTISQGGEMILPFFWQYNAMNLNNGDFNNMGNFYIHEFNPLQHANGGTSPITVSTFIWAEDVQVSCPTSMNISGLVSQSDEYDIKPVSHTATAIADAADRLMSVPIIRPYARATSLAMRLAAGVANSFGFSRPALIDNVSNMLPQYIGPIANTDRGDNCTKLTVDSKQELTVDTRVVGLNGDDEMTLHNIATRETFLTTISWLPTDAPGSFKWNARVRPGYSTTSGSLTYIPACTFASLPFKYWRGTMRYRFQVVASNFHRGRIKILYDPGVISSDEANVLYTRVVDIGEEKEFTLDVGWSNERTFCQTRTVNSADPGFRTIAYTTTSRAQTNGTLALYILNELTTPSAESGILGVYINVFVSMGEDCQFAVPIASQIDEISYLPKTSTLTFQSQEYDFANAADAPEASSSDSTICHTQVQPDETFLVYFGEKISSFRQMLKRYNYHSSYIIQPGTAIAFSRKIWLSDFPLFKGYTALGINSGPQNVCKTTLLNYLAPAYAGMRGGLRSKYIVSTDEVAQVTPIIALRENSEGVLYSSVATNIDYTSNDTVAASKLVAVPMCHSGAHLTTMRLQPNVELELPFYSNARFLCPKDLSGTLTDYTAFRYGHSITVNSLNNMVSSMDRFVSVAEDFNLFFFQGCPPIYL